MLIDFGLNIVPAEDMIVSRIRDGDRFTYVDTIRGVAVSKTRRREIELLVIPPNWSDVMIAAKNTCHLQAVGRDAAGRLQYRYHDKWPDVRNAVKADRLLSFGRALPAIRARMNRDLKRTALSKPTVAATALRLIDRKLVRPGHEQYASAGTFGAASLSGRHVSEHGADLEISFVGKSGKTVHFSIADQLLRRRLTDLKRRNRGRIFKYSAGERKKELGAQDVNKYIRDVTSRGISAKDFRTFRASALAMREFCEIASLCEAARRKRAVSRVMKSISEALRNTPAVTRSSYVHPTIVQAYVDGTLDPGLMKGRCRRNLSREETALMRFLEQELG